MDSDIPRRHFPGSDDGFLSSEMEEQTGAAAAEGPLPEGHLWRRVHYGDEVEAPPKPLRRTDTKSSRDVGSMLAAGRITQTQAHRLTTTDKMRRSSMESRQSIEATQKHSEYTSTSGMIAEALGTSRRNAVSTTILRDLGIESLRTRVIEERRRRASPWFEQPFPILERVVDSVPFDVFVGAVMLFNGVLIGVQVSHGEEEFWMEVSEHVCTAVFVLEVSFRLLVSGWVWICSVGNILDVLLIFSTGVLPMWILKPVGVRLSDMSILQTLRTLRLMRLVRTLRINRHFRTPFKLVKGLVDSRRTIFHTYVVSGISLFISSVFGVYLIGRDRSLMPGSPFASEEAWPAVHQVAHDFFFTVPRSSFTLFQVTTLDSWTSVARPLMKYSVGVPFIFTLVIMVNALVLQNLITAVIVKNALACFSQDEELMVAELKEKMKADVQELRAVFKSVDSDFNNLLSLEEFLEAVRSEESLRTKLKLLQVGPDEATDFWDLLCEGNEDGIGLERFAEMMQAMGADAKAKDSFAITQHLRRLNNRITCIKGVLLEQKQKVDLLREDLKTVRSEFVKMLAEAQDFVYYVGNCIPVAPAPRKAAQLTNARVLL